MENAAREILRRVRRPALGAALVLLCLAILVPAAAAQEKLPGGVVSRVKKINEYLNAVETRLKTGSVDRNDLDRARDALEEIRKGYAASMKHPDVVAAEKRIAQVAKLLDDFEASKKQKKAQAEGAAAAEEKTLVDWARKLSAYKADTKPGSKGYFGIPSGEVEAMLAARGSYEEAKALYAEFLKTGLDKDSHPDLRQAEYDIRTAILNYEASRERVPAEAERKLDEALAWMAEQKAGGKGLSLGKDQQASIALLVENTVRLFPGTAKTRALIAKKADLDRRIEEADASILEARVMRADSYAGKDSAELKKMAQTVAQKEHAGAAVLKVNITSAAWETESAVEWTDTTRTALRYRATDFVYAQVAVKAGADVFLYTVYLNKDRIDGKEQPLTGHVMYRDRLLEKNIR
jgi:hypothetical protein